MVDPRDGTRKALKKMPNVFQNTVSCRRVYRELKMLTALKHDNVSVALYIDSVSTKLACFCSIIVKCVNTSVASLNDVLKPHLSFSQNG